MLLVQIKPDQTAAFEELIAEAEGGAGDDDRPALKAQAPAWKVFKATEPMQGNALYVVVVDPAMPSAEYELIDMLFKTMTDGRSARPRRRKSSRATRRRLPGQQVEPDARSAVGL